LVGIRRVKLANTDHRLGLVYMRRPSGNALTHTRHVPIKASTGITRFHRRVYRYSSLSRRPAVPRGKVQNFAKTVPRCYTLSLFFS
jgi:hypothetical protein